MTGGVLTNYSSEDLGYRKESEGTSSDYTDGTHVADENKLGNEIDQVEADIELYGLQNFSLMFIQHLTLFRNLSKDATYNHTYLRSTISLSYIISTWPCLLLCQ